MRRCDRRSRVRTPGERPPLAVEDRVRQLALPLAFHVLVLDQVRFLSHPELVQDARRRDVPSLGTADDAVQLHILERQSKEHADSLGGVSVTLMVGVDDEPESRPCGARG